MVYVISQDDKPLMPCSNPVARLLLKQGKAKVKKREPFTIKLTYETTGYTQDLTLGVDTGSGTIGAAVSKDNGDIIYTSETEILDSDNLESLHDRLSIMGRDLLLQTMPSIINGTNKRIKQNEEEVTYAYNIKREEEHIDLSKTRREVFNQIRGLSPVPGANLLVDGDEFKIYRAEISERKFTNKEIGEVTGLYKEGIGVMTLDGEIILTDIKPFGKKRMSAPSYINGLRDKSLIGKVLK